MINVISNLEKVSSQNITSSPNLKAGPNQDSEEAPKNSLKQAVRLMTQKNKAQEISITCLTIGDAMT